MAAVDRPSTATRPTGASPSGDKSLPELGRELVDLTVAYAKQETIEPLKSMGPRVGLGVLGSGTASVGLIFLLVGVLRLLQVELALRGLWSFLPYLVALAVAGAVAFAALRQIGQKR
ncbi:MAG: phage holin family protein [Acidimicrobiales bacterium]